MAGQLVRTAKRILKPQAFLPTSDGRSALRITSPSVLPPRNCTGVRAERDELLNGSITPHFARAIAASYFNYDLDFMRASE